MPKTSKCQVDLEVLTNIIIMENKTILPEKATHVGVLRSPVGNEHAIADRISAHRRAIFSVLHTGLARSHNGNPHASLRIETIFGTSVLVSGLASLVLSKKEVGTLSHHFKIHLERLLRLNQACPSPLVFFAAGCPPFPGLLHTRMLSLFGQLCRLRSGDNILARHALTIYSSTSLSSKSWFWQIRDICLQYDLPHPLQWLENPPEKVSMKKDVKCAIHSYWLRKLRTDAEKLKSLRFLKGL